VRLGNHDLEALIDSGSGQSLVINPAGILPRFAFGPVEGPVVATLAGDRVSYVGRVDGVLRIGSFDIPNPVSEVTDELSSVGGGILSHFIVTFDQEHDEVFFQAGSDADIVVPALRGTGMSFRKTPAYWKVVGVIQDSPAAAAAVTKGDLVSRINGEPVTSWDPARFEHLLAKAATIDFTFIQGASEAVRQIQVVDIVP
jgi:membrane-associated protease RseP (regulator of RpoE activity)